MSWILDKSIYVFIKSRFDVVTSQLPDPNHWKAFRRKGLHFLHLNVNSLLPKIDEVKLIANKYKATNLGISETNLDKTILDNELLIEGYDLIR